MEAKKRKHIIMDSSSQTETNSNDEFSYTGPRYRGELAEDKGTDLMKGWPTADLFIKSSDKSPQRPKKAQSKRNHHPLEGG